MRAIEENVKPAVPESAKDTFRQGVLMRIGIALRKGERPLTHETDTILATGIEEYLFDQLKDIVQVTVSKTNPDKEQAKRLNEVLDDPDRGARLQRALRTRPARLRRSPPTGDSTEWLPGLRPGRRTTVWALRLPQDAGRRDALHHRERLRKKITEQLKERIGEEDIIASGPEKKVRVPVKGTKRWQFIFDRGREAGRRPGRRRARRRARPAGQDAPGRGEAGHRAGRGALRGLARHGRRRGDAVLRARAAAAQAQVRGRASSRRGPSTTRSRARARSSTRRRRCARTCCATPSAGASRWAGSTSPICAI